jgi:hypothetical protein
MKTIIIVAVLLISLPAHATTIIFADGTQWIGTFELPNQFSAIIGECVHPLDCLHNDQVETGLGPFIADTTIGFEIIGTQRELHGIADGVRFWQTNNGFDSVPIRTGHYCVVSPY